MKKILRFVILIICVSLSWQMVFAQSAEDVATIEVAQVDNSAYPQVTVYVRVLDQGGKRVPDLTADLFHIEEDGQQVDIVGFSAINEDPIQTLMLLDVSGSMNEFGKLQGAQAAALAFIDLMRPQDQVGLLAFNHETFELLPFTSDVNQLRNQIATLFANGGTAWYDAVIQASGRASSLAGRKSLLLLTDGLDESSRRSFRSAVGAAQDSGASVYTIGLGPQGAYDESRLEGIAEQTSGAFYHAPSAAELEELYRQIALSTQDEYVLTYHSPRPDFDGTRRDITVRVGETGGSGGYVEQHLLTVQSDWLVGLLFLVPLGLALLLPTVGRVAQRRRRARTPQPPISEPQPASSTGTCAHCKRPLRPRARFCSACGQPQPAAPPVAATRTPEPAVPLNCPICGRPLRPGAKFCSGCGNQVS